MMRIAVLSDIHSNLQAFERVLLEIEKRSIDKTYCLGDIVGYGAHPNECIDLLRRLNISCLMGNHDSAVLNPSQARDLNKPGRSAAEWTTNVLSDENREFLSQLPYRIEFDQCTLVHASPKQPKSWHYILSLEDAEPQFDSFSTTLCFIGHTHIPFICGEDLRTFAFKRAVRLLINVGSVGQPRDGNPQLSFGLLDTGQWTYENIRLPYDIDSAANAIIANKLPRVLATRLYKGL